MSDRQKKTKGEGESFEEKQRRTEKEKGVNVRKG